MAHHTRILPRVSIPPFLDSPRGVVKHTFPVADAPIAVLVNQRVFPGPASAGLSHAGERVLLVPGFTGSKEDFIAVLQPLAAAGVAAVAMDQRGQFESASVAPAKFTLAAHAADLRLLAETCWPDGPRPHLVGHSFGGLVARMAVISAPDSFASLTLLDSGPGSLPAHQHPDLRALQAALPEIDLAAIWQLQQELAAARGTRTAVPADIADFLRRRWLANDPQALHSAAEILLNEPDRVVALRATGVPTAVLFGTTDDVWLPETQISMAERLHALACSQMWGEGHSPAASAPAATTAALLGFWSLLRPASAALPRSRLVAESDGYISNMAVYFEGTSDLRAIRHAVRAQTDAWGFTAVADDVELVTSELLSNASQHGSGVAWVGLHAGHERVRVEVSDHNHRLPRPLQPTSTQPHGRGCQVVAALSTSWGVVPSPDGKTVWAEVSTESDEPDIGDHNGPAAGR